jgi:Porin subfamily
MKFVKSLMLGVAASLIAMSGAQAADLPVKAKPVEYVRICSLYGAGFFYIPGTDTCIKLGGYLRVETAVGTNTIFGGPYNGPAGAFNRYSNYFTARSREDLNIDTRTATEYGVLRTFFDATFSWTTGTLGVSSVGTVLGNDQIAGGTLGVYFAFIQFAGFTMGKAISQFSLPWTNYPANNFDGLVGGGGDQTGVNQLSYTWQFGNGTSFTLSAQDPYAYYYGGLFNTSFPGVTAANPLATVVGANFGSTPYGVPTQGGFVAPDLVAKFAIEQAWGLFQASFAAHDNHAGYFTATNELTGHPIDKWGWAGQLGASFNLPMLGAGDSLNISGVYTNGASRYNFQDRGPTTFAMYGGTSFPGGYQSLGFAQVTDAVFGGTDVRTGLVTGLELVSTWGMRGGYTHNWNTYWNTSIFGAWAQVSYTGAAKALICTNIAAVAVPGSGFTCNPNFQIGQIGTKTGWTPVKNLTFSGEIVYSNLDQQYTGAVRIPAISALAKPTAVYDLKDQSTWTFLARAQRNW